MKNEVISIDGPSGSGKTSVGKLLAKKLEAKFISSGNLYRTIANGLLHLKTSNILFSKNTSWEDIYNQLATKNLSVSIAKFNTEEALIEVSQKVTNSNQIQNVDTKNNYSAEITDLSSRISQFSNIRTCVNVYLKDYVSQNLLTVVEGRDIGSVVFKDAKLKIYIDSPLELRAKRRLTQSSNEEGIKDMIRRDTSDTKRENSPLIIPDGSIIIVNEKQSIDEIVEIILQEYRGLEGN